MQSRQPLVLFLLILALLLSAFVQRASAEVPAKLQKWLGPQEWTRDSDQPALALGEGGTFDDSHLLAPVVVQADGRYRMWYCGSSGYAYDLSPTRTRDERVYQLGLATSDDGLTFEKQATPRVALPDAKRSFLTPTILRNTDGRLQKFQGKYWMWFCSATLGGGGRPHSVQAATSDDGLHWTNITDDLLTRAYCPAVIEDDGELRMWYTAPGPYPWVIKHARSTDGVTWKIDPEPVLEKSQEWEHFVFNYPVVHKIDDVYLMWYTSYSTEDRDKVAIGFAASEDGIHWHKHPDNPVLRPCEDNEWESNYVSSGSVVRLPDGSFRIWYSARKAPPFMNLYYAFGSATWGGPGEDE